MTDKQGNISKELMCRIIDYIEKHDNNVYYGYDVQGDFIIIADWNNNKLNSLDNWLSCKYYEHKLITLGFHDEYCFCDNCSNLIDMIPRYYGDTGWFMITDEGVFCKDCIISDPDIIIDYCINKNDTAIPEYLKDYIIKEGFTCFSNDYNDEYCPIYETGFHQHQNDNPKDIEKRILELKHDYDYLFMINSVGQFDVKWSAFIRRQ